MLEFLLCVVRLIVGGLIIEFGKSCVSSVLIITEIVLLGGVSGGVIKSGVVFGVGGIILDGWMKNLGVVIGLEGIELWIGFIVDIVDVVDVVVVVVVVVWCNLVFSFVFCKRSKSNKYRLILFILILYIKYCVFYI